MCCRGPNDLRVPYSLLGLQIYLVQCTWEAMPTVVIVPCNNCSNTPQNKVMHPCCSEFTLDHQLLCISTVLKSSVQAGTVVF